MNKLPTQEQLKDYVFDNLGLSNSKGTVVPTKEWKRYVSDYVCYEFKVVAPTKKELKVLNKRFMKALRPIWF